VEQANRKTKDGVCVRERERERERERGREGERERASERVREKETIESGVFVCERERGSV